MLGGNLVLLGLALLYGVLAWCRGVRWAAPGPLLLAMTLGATALAFLPSPTWAMYYAAVAPLLACCIAHLDRRVWRAQESRARRIVGLAALMPLALPLLLLVHEATEVASPDRWVGIIAHRRATAIAAALDGRPGPVATLFPIWVADRTPLRPDLATGPFVFRSAGAFDAALLNRLGALTPDSLDQAFAAAPPAGIYTGPYAAAWSTPMDAPLTAWAERHGWRLVWTDESGGRLYVP